MATNREPLAGKRLDSWKEIAAFLGRAERTVKRWESERGLPVHRVPGGGRSAVFAYTNELAEWLKGRSDELDADDSASGEVEDRREVRKDDREADSAGATLPTAPSSTVTTTVSSPVQVAIKNWPPARLAAWIVPFLLAAGLVIYLSTGHSSPHVKALAGRQPSNAEANDLPLGLDSIAVLPFTNMQGDPDTDYLSDGITESLISGLAHIPHLKVRSRDSVFRYKGKDLDIQTIGTSLGVLVLVSGRMMRKGNNIEISTELTNIRDNTEIWGHHYSGKSGDLISLQQQMAGDIAERLRSTLTSADKLLVTRQGTQNPEAYALYLKGRYAWNKRTRSDLEAAISYFTQAIAQDPDYAQAYSGLADVYSVLQFFGANPRQTFPKSNAAARKALELDPTLARPHAVLGNNETEYDWDFAGGEAEFKKAIELDPNDATSHQWYGEKLSVVGRHQEGLVEINRAHELDPLSPVIARVLGGTLIDSGQYDQGIAVCKQLVQDNPTFAIAHNCLADAYWAKHMYAQVVEESKLQAQLSGSREDIENAAALERGFRSGGWPQALTELIALYEGRRKTGYASPFEIARLYADHGDKEKAFEWLDIAYREHDCFLIGLNTWFQFDSLHSDPRFAELVRKIGLPKVQ
ncbi:MAG TPA: tetratricopeptide repeat protein [Terriglobales bacterium]|nr:tetratricopeptide repeat protein [Terriglobales bacterium]